MNVETWLKQVAKILETAGIGTARLDSLVLLEDATSKDRSWLLAHSDTNLSQLLAQGPSFGKCSLDELNAKVERRTAHEPLAYIRGRTEFYGREFYVDHRVLEPRPESETIITMLKTFSLSENCTIVDVGTGSGALAITAKLELPTAEVWATDVDPACLTVAHRNAERHGTDISFTEADLLVSQHANKSKKVLFSDHSQKKDVVVLANLPYVPDDFTVNAAALQEPHLAIFGGTDGLDLYRRLFKQLRKVMIQSVVVCTESLPPQHEALEMIAQVTGFHLQQAEDFIQLFKR